MKTTLSFWKDWSTLMEQIRLGGSQELVQNAKNLIKKVSCIACVVLMENELTKANGGK